MTNETNISPRDTAFIRAYSCNVATANDATVTAYVHAKNEGIDGDEIGHRFNQEATSMEDAYGVFYDGEHFGLKTHAIEFLAALRQLQKYSSNELVLVDGCKYNIQEKINQLDALAKS